MNKAQLVEAIADKLGGQQQAAHAVDAVLDAMVRAVVAGERVSVAGIGSFERLDRTARNAGKPQTNERAPAKQEERRLKSGDAWMPASSELLADGTISMSRPRRATENASDE